VLSLIVLTSMFLDALFLGLMFARFGRAQVGYSPLYGPRLGVWVVLIAFTISQICIEQLLEGRLVCVRVYPYAYLYHYARLCACEYLCCEYGLV